MTQGLIPFKYKSEQRPSGMTALAGLPLYFDLMSLVKLDQLFKEHLPEHEKKQGWTYSQCATSLILLNIAGGDVVDDIKCLNRDYGLARLIQKIQTQGMRRKQRRETLKRWRKENKGAFPAPSSIFRFLDVFHDPHQEELRKTSDIKAFIPEPNDALRGLYAVNKGILARLQELQPQTKATLDMDGTIVATCKKNALPCYKGFLAYQPVNLYWFERDLFLHSEFRDGNVAAGHDLLRVFKQACAMLPKGIKEVFLRSDTAGYKINLLKHCQEGKDKRFGKITFAIGVDVCEAFRQAVAQVEEDQWHTLYKTVAGEKRETRQQWAEVCYVPNWIGHSKKSPEYRFIAIREKIRQLTIPEADMVNSYSFPTYQDKKQVVYKLYGVVTNWAYDQKDGNQVIEWYRKRCGKSEKVHGAQKNDLAGGTLPSADVGANAAWWYLMVISFNLNAIMKGLVLEHVQQGWITKYMKAIRFHIINIPARIHLRARQLLITVAWDQPAFNILLKARKRMLNLAHAPP
jgi:hypothetical protein